MMMLLLSLLLFAARARAEPLHMQPLGVYCGSIHSNGNMSCRESTPVLWPPGSGQLVLVEHHSNFRVRRQRHNNVTNNTVIAPSVPGSANFAFVSAIVVNARPVPRNT